MSSQSRTIERVPLLLIGLLVSLTAMAALMADRASAEFGFSELGVSVTGAQEGDPVLAGAHPYRMTTTVEFETKSFGTGFLVPFEEPKDVVVELPPGFVGNPDPVPTCPDALFATVNENNPASACPAASTVGVAEIAADFEPIKSVEETYEKTRNSGTSPMSVYNLDPPPGVASKLGFIVLKVPVTIEVKVNPDPPYNLFAEVTNISNLVQTFGSKVTLWGNPAHPSHDAERGGCALTVAADLCPAGLPQEIAFLTLPASCEPMVTTFSADSWVNPGVWTAPKSVVADDGAAPPGPGDPTGCESLEFEPTIEAKPTTTSAASSSGLDFDLHMDNEGLVDPAGRSEATIERAEVTLPQGLTPNPSLAGGLAGCTPAQLKAETLKGHPGEGCPEASKIGSVEVETPILKDKVVAGDVFLASPHDNPFDSLLATYVVIRERELGLLFRLAGRVEPDPRTGQLRTVFGEGAAPLPQLPFSDFRFHLRGGERAPLSTPRTCGTYTTRAVLTPSSGQPPVVRTSSFEVTSGPGGGPCPAPGGFTPGFGGGTVDNAAGSFSPLLMRITRGDADQELSRLSSKLPPGLVAKLAGTSPCPEASIAQAKSKSGKAELASPSCPGGSRIGRVLAGAGVGPDLTYVGGSLHLAGPYNGAPLSAVAVVPAVTGPFDLGTVVTRLALRVDPRTAKVQIDGERSEPIPHILQGVPLKVRDIRAYADRPNFTLNPTSCNPFELGATLWGTGADPFAPADDPVRSLASRFQAAGCAALGFKPRLSLRLKGGTKRGKFPALRGEYRPRPGDANLAKLVVRLPRSAFLEQGHIRTICTRVQWAADACPKAAIYGKATAYTPLLSEPLTGPVYMRSSDNDLPDLVADLRGLIDVEAVARIDSQRRAIRATFTEVPDAPLTRVVVKMQGGKKGLIVNSTDICRAKGKAAVQLSAHNARRAKAKPRAKATGCRKARGGGKRRGAR